MTSLVSTAGSSVFRSNRKLTSGNSLLSMSSWCSLILNKNNTSTSGSPLIVRQLPERLQCFFHMSLNADFPPFLDDSTGRIDQEGRSFDPHVFLAEVFLECPDSVLFRHLMIFVHQEPERQSVLIDELRMGRLA